MLQQGGVTFPQPCVPLIAGVERVIQLFWSISVKWSPGSTMRRPDLKRTLWRERSCLRSGMARNHWSSEVHGIEKRKYEGDAGRWMERHLRSSPEPCTVLPFRTLPIRRVAALQYDVGQWQCDAPFAFYHSDPACPACRVHQSRVHPNAPHGNRTTVIEPCHSTKRQRSCPSHSPGFCY
jgi:hypothetical protein